jgi:hypothetical protein
MGVPLIATPFIGMPPIGVPLMSPHLIERTSHGRVCYRQQISIVANISIELERPKGIDT